MTKTEGKIGKFEMDFDSIWRPGRLIFTFGTCWSREGAYSEQGAYFSFEKQPNAQRKL